MAGYCDEKMILPEFDMATCTCQPSPLVTGMSTHLDASDDVVDVEGLDQRPELEIRLDEPAQKVELSREDSLKSEVSFGLRGCANLEAIRAAGSRCGIVEHLADLAAGRQRKDV